MGTSTAARTARRAGSSRSSSVSALMGKDPGRVDSAPMSMMSAPWAASSRASRAASSGPVTRPPSEKESGVKLMMPAMYVRRPRRNSRLPMITPGFLPLQAVQQFGQAEIDQQADAVADGGDEGRRGHGGVQAQLGQDERQGGAEKTRRQDGAQEGAAGGQTHVDVPRNVIGHRTARQAHPQPQEGAGAQFPQQGAPEMAGMDLAGGQGPHHQGHYLGPHVARRIHDHGNEKGQTHHGR